MDLFAAQQHTQKFSAHADHVCYGVFAQQHKFTSQHHSNVEVVFHGLIRLITHVLIPDTHRMA